MKMNNLQIDHILRSDSCTATDFVGVYPRDWFVDSFVRGIRGLFVVNTDVSSERGEHWFAVRSIPGESVYYFDSYGLPPKIFPDVYSALEVEDEVIISNAQQFQGVDTSVCGDYCTIFHLLMSCGLTFDNVCDEFRSINDTDTSDHAVRDIISRP